MNKAQERERRARDGSSSTEQAVRVTRVFSAPRELVWQALTVPNQLQQWWGPKTFTAPHASIDLRVGGKYLFAMRSPKGKDLWSTGHFLSITHGVGYEIEDSFADEQGNVVAPSAYDMPDFPTVCFIKLELSDRNGGTALKLEHRGIPKDQFENCAQGWKESFDKLSRSVTERAS